MQKVSLNMVSGGLELQQSVNEVSSQLAETVKKGQASVTDINKNLGKFDQTYMTDEFLQQIAGTTPVASVPARESLVRGQLTPGAVTPDLLSFATKPNNLFNVADVTKGFTIASSTGALSANASFAVTDFVYVKPSQTYIMKDIPRYALYTQAGVFISSATTLTFTTPANAYFARFVTGLGTLQTAQVNEGSTLLDYDAHEYHITSTNKTPINIVPSPKSVTQDALTKNIVLPYHAAFFENGKNLYNRFNAIAGKSIDLNGVLTDEADRSLSDFISVTPGQTYSKTDTITVRWACYDRQKNFIRRNIANIGETTFVIPTGCHYIRMSPATADSAALMVNEGATLLPYEPHGFVLKSTTDFPFTIDSALLPEGGGTGGGGTGGDLGMQAIYEQNQSVAAGATLAVCDVALTSEVDIIEFSSNGLLAELQIYYKQSDGAEFLYDLVTNNGGAPVPNTFANMQIHGSSIVEFIEFDDRNFVFKVAAKGLKFADGFRVVAKNTDTTAKNIAVRVVSRQYA